MVKPRLLALAAPLALFLFAGASVRADELIRFKSGYEMLVVAHREEQGMVIVTLDGGGEIGFPKDAIYLLEGGKPSASPSRNFNRIPDRGVLIIPRKPPPRASSGPAAGTKAVGAFTGQAIRVGYSMHGEKMQRLTEGPTGAVEGTAASDFAEERGSMSPKKHGKSGPKTMKPDEDENPD